MTHFSIHMTCYLLLMGTIATLLDYILLHKITAQHDNTIKYI